MIFRFTASVFFLLFCIIMSVDYSTWSLEELRNEAEARNLRFSSKDGVKTLVSKLRRNDRRSTGDSSTGEVESPSAGKSGLSEKKGGGMTFEEQIQLLELERKIRMEERETEKEMEKMRMEEKEKERERKKKKKERKKKKKERLKGRSENLRRRLHS